MGLAGLSFYNYFLYDRKPLPYNRLPYAGCTERTIEIPIAVRFLQQTGAGLEEPFLEVGNVLANYEELLTSEPSLGNRVVIDPFDDAPSVRNVDIRDYDTRHAIIVCLSAATHRGEYAGGSPETDDREAPLRTIRRLYDLLKPGGEALITVPYGKLMDCGWLVQFSEAYLRLLSEAYGMPPDAIEVDYFRKRDMELHLNAPRQSWVQCEAEELEETTFDSPFLFANGLAVVRLRKTAEAGEIASRDTDSLVFMPSPPVSNLYFAPFIRPSDFDGEGFFPLPRAGYVFYGPYLHLAAGSYALQASIEIDGPGEFTLELTSGRGKRLLWSLPVVRSEKLNARIELASDEEDAEIRLYKRNLTNCRVRVPVLRLNAET